MSNEEIRSLLTKLQNELQETELDDETRSMVQELDSDIHGLLESGEDSDSIMQHARQLESDFATVHPTAERFMREVIETLARMGI
jgi:hypothetical protein